MKAYLDVIENILENGTRKENRTGVDTIGVFGVKFEHDMSEGFPLVTTKKMAYKNILSELEFFIKGYTDKRWLQERNNHIWDEWCTPKKVPYGHDVETLAKMRDERDLGPIYGFQWRHFGAEYKEYNTDYSGQGKDQLAKLVDKIKNNPTDRRMIVSAWNPTQLEEMALPPCHYQFQANVSEGKLDLAWSQRSVDTMLGLPFNIASYATLLHLLAKEAGLQEGKLTGFLGDTHIYENHLSGAKEQVKRTPLKLPRMVTENFKSIFDWQYTDSKIIDYEHREPIKFKIAV